MWGRNWKKNAHYIFYLHIFISWKKKGGGSALNIFSIFYTHHRIPNKHMMTINFDTITNNYEVIYVIKTVMKYHLKKIDTSFHQPLPNMVQRLFADVINDAIWFMNIHEQNHPWFLAMMTPSTVVVTTKVQFGLKQLWSSDGHLEFSIIKNRQFRPNQYYNLPLLLSL